MCQLHPRVHNICAPFFDNLNGLSIDRFIVLLEEKYFEGQGQRKLGKEQDEERQVNNRGGSEDDAKRGDSNVDGGCQI